MTDNKTETNAKYSVNTSKKNNFLTSTMNFGFSVRLVMNV